MSREELYIDELIEERAELLEACQGIVRMLLHEEIHSKPGIHPCFTENHPLIHQAQIAIKKATE